MDILVICHYGLYRDLNASFVHSQVREFVRLGHRVRVIIPVGMGKPDPGGRRFTPLLEQREADGAQLYYLRYLTLSRWGEGGLNAANACAAVSAQTKRLFDDFRPGVIHAHTLGFDSRIGARLKKRFHCPLVVTTHGSDTTLPLERGKQKELGRACADADTVVCVSSALARKLAGCGTRRPLRVILNGYQPRHLAPDGEKDLLAWIQAGHLLEQKRFSVTIRAFAGFCRRHPGASLTIVGSGPQRAALEDLCRRLNVEKEVCFTGQIPNEEVLRRMSRSRFYVMPSVGEGFGIVYLEAMASGCVVIGTEGEGIADLIENGVNGFLVPPDDPEAILEAAERCAAEPETADAVAEAGRRSAEGLTWEHNARQYEDLFRNLAGQ